LACVTKELDYWKEENGILMVIDSNGTSEKQNSETGPPGFGRIRSQGSVIL
jgi:hypothetical protein